MTAKALTADQATMAVGHVYVLAVAGDADAATSAEQELKDRFIQATAAGLCPDPVAVAKTLATLKDIDFPRGSTATTGSKHRLDALLGRVPHVPQEP